MSIVWLAQSANGTSYMFAGFVGDISVTTLGEPLDQNEALILAKLIKAVDPDVEVKLSNVASGDPVVAEITGGKK